MVRENSALQLGGYEVHRLGTTELVDQAVLAAGAVKIGILLVATLVFIVVYGFLADYLQRRGP